MEKETGMQRGDSILAFKAGFWYTLGNFLGKAITIITTPIFARLMTTSDYGEFINFSNWAVTIIIVASLELHNTLSKAYYDFKNEYDDYITTVTILGVGVTAVVYTFFLLFPQTFLKIVSIPKQYINLLFIFVVFTYCGGVFKARERTLYRYKTVAVITFISIFFPTLISVFLIYLLPGINQLSARLYGFYIPSTMISVYCAIKLFQRSRVFKLRYCKYALVLSVPLLFHYLAAYLLNATNNMITKAVVGAEAAAIVSIASSMTNIFTVLSQSVSGALTTWLMDNLELGKIATVKIGSFYYVAMFSLIVIFSILLGPEIVFFFGGVKYAASIILLPGFMFAAFVQSVTTVFTIILTYDKNVVKPAVYTGILAISSIVAKKCLLPDNEFIILAHINIVVFVILFVINYMLVKQAGYAEAVNFKGFAGVILITGVIMMAAPWLYNATSMRYALIGLLTFFLVLAFVCNKEAVTVFANKYKKKKGNTQ